MMEGTDDALPGEVPVQVLVLRTPGAGSSYITTVIDLLAHEIASCTCGPVHVTSAVGTPADRLPYTSDVLVHLDPLDGVLDVAVTFASCRDSYRFRTDCAGRQDVRSIAREIGRHIDAARPRDRAPSRVGAAS